MKKLNILLLCLSLTILATSVDSQVCVGTPGELEWKAWRGLYDDELSELVALPSYPGQPDTTKTIFKLESPDNYAEYFGARVEGFIRVDTNTVAEFNITANRYARFYLSTNDDPANSSLLIYNTSSVGQLDHNEQPEQTSAPINLVAGQYYYFLLEHVDGSGSDNFNIWWKTDLVDTANWNIITAGFLYGVDCIPDCPEAGTTCDDMDPTTINDIEDGHCNCFGEKITSNTCIGEKGIVTGYRYDGVPGGSLNDLYEATNFPGTPSYSENYEFFSKRSTNTLSDVGHAIQAYLTVPVTGLYKFNVTGDDNTILFISSDEDPENKQAHQCLVSSWTRMTEHDKFIYQSTSNILLEKGKYYYIEINSNDGGGSEHFSAFWQTPFTEAGVWKRIPAIYFNDYDCEIACIPQGTLCDDGDPFTNNDMYDSNCECVGTPCSGLDCDSPLANYVPYDKCSLTEKLDDNADNNWLSCQASANPNPLRNNGHWLEFDLGERHELYNTHFWNYNVNPGFNQGMQSIAIDFSEDGNTWQELQIFNLPLATGDSGYTGDPGPNFNGIYARYILITSLDGPTGCRGLGKVAFTAVLCPNEGTACDDGDAETFNDRYDKNCECKGSPFDANDCGEMTVMLGDSTLTTSKHSAIEQVMSISKIASENKVSFIGGKNVILDVGFETNGQTLFQALIDTCETIIGGEEFSRADLIAAQRQQQQNLINSVLTITPLNNADGEVMISYYVPEPGETKLEIYNAVNNKVFTLVEHQFNNKGLFHKKIRMNRFDPGNYQVRLSNSKGTKAKVLNVTP